MARLRSGLDARDAGVSTERILAVALASTAWMRRAAIESVDAAAAAIAAAWSAAETPAANVTMSGLVASGAGGVGSGVGFGRRRNGLGRRVRRRFGARFRLGRRCRLCSAGADGSGGGDADGSSDGCGSDGSGSAAMVPIGATSVKTRRLTCSPIRSRQEATVPPVGGPEREHRHELPRPAQVTARQPRVRSLQRRCCEMMSSAIRPMRTEVPYGPADRTTQ